MFCSRTFQLISSIKNYGTVSDAPINPAASAISPSVDPTRSVFHRAIEAQTPRTNWTRDEIKELYDTPLMELAFAAVRIKDFN